MSRSVQRTTKRKRLVIIGAGLAGLSAGEMVLRHAQQSVDVTILEAKRVAGGRAGSFEDPHSGRSIDYCQHVAMGCCLELIALLKRCGLYHHWQRSSRLEFHHPDHPISVLEASPWLPAPLHLAGAIGRLNYLSRQQQRQIRSGLWRLMRTPTASLRSQTAREWLFRAGQDEDTIAQFWEVVLVSALGDRTENVSMAAARKVFIDGFAAFRGASDVLVPKLPLSDLFGIRLVDVIEKLGGTVRHQTPVRGLIFRGDSPEHTAPDGPVMLETGGATGRKEMIVTDAVICAVPWHQVAKLIRPDVFQLPAGLAKMPVSPITGVHCWFDRPWMQQPHAVMVGTTIQWVFRDPLQSEHPVQLHDEKVAHDGGGHYYQLVISAVHGQRWQSSDGGATGQDGLMKILLAEIRHAFPDARRAKLLSHRMVADPMAVFSVRPGMDAVRLTANSGPSWLHFAGDWTDTQWPATMEGAVISGRLAAASALRSIVPNSLEEPNACVLQPSSWGWLTRRLVVP